MNAEKPLTPGQQRLLRLFKGGNFDVVLHPVDLFELRICAALQARGVLAPYEGADEACQGGYELTEAGRGIVAQEAAR